MPNFLVDTQLPPALAKFLDKTGYPSKHTSSYPKGYFLKDEEIIEIAKQHTQIIITKDSDFWDNFFLRGYPPDVLLLELGNIKNADLIALFQQNITQIVTSFENGAHLIVLDRDKLTCF
jgi:predicted nuclease of predicted toxin-antitoxin system